MNTVVANASLSTSQSLAGPESGTGMLKGGRVTPTRSPGAAGDDQLLLEEGIAQVVDRQDPELPGYWLLKWPTQVIPVSDFIGGESGLFFLALHRDGQLVIRSEQLSADDTGEWLGLVRVGYAEGAITNVVSEQRQASRLADQLFDFVGAVGSLAVQGLDLRAGGEPVQDELGYALPLRVTAGIGVRLGASYGTTSSPNTVEYSEDLVPAIRYLHRDGDGGWVVRSEPGLRPGWYDDDGRLRRVRARWTVQPIYFSVPTGQLFIQLGQITYRKYSDAFEAVLEDSWERHPVLSTEMVRRALVIVRGTCQDLTDRSSCRVLPCGRFGGLGGR